MNAEDSIADFPWEWVRNSIYGFPMTLLPFWKEETSLYKKKMKFMDLMKKHRISAELECPIEHVQIEKPLLMKIGMYPEKGDIRIGGEVDYNLYVLNEFNSVEEKFSGGYHNHIPEFTIHKGQLIKAGHKIYLKPGFGEHFEIAMSGRFAANTVP
jgi:hypothetical protein